MSSYDAWLAHNPADDDVEVVTYDIWSTDRDMQDRFPMEDTACAICKCGIGCCRRGHKEDDPVYEDIHILPDERALCVSCAEPELDYDYPEEDD